MRPENIATASSDGSFRIWSLNADAVPLWDSLDRTAPCVDAPVWNKSIVVPWAADAHDRGLDEDDVHDPSYDDDYEPDTMLLVGADALGVWGRQVTDSISPGDETLARVPIIQGTIQMKSERKRRLH